MKGIIYQPLIGGKIDDENLEPVSFANIRSRRLRPKPTEEVAYDVTFAFVYNAFFPERVIRTN